MALYTYHHRVVTIAIDRQWLMWVNDYLLKAAAKSGNDPRFLRRLKQFKAHKICSAAYAQHYALMDQWQDHHQPINIWPPRDDFTQEGKRIKLVCVSANEQAGEFGPHLMGRIWDSDYKRKHDRYVLACWYPPFVDLIGWLAHDELENYQRVSNFGGQSYDLQEIVTHPMGTMLS